MVVALIGTMPHRRPPRLPTFDYRGAYRYFVTCCTSGRRRVFIEGDVVQLLVQQILHAGAKHRFAVLAYVFMPDHLHLLVEGQTTDAKFRPFMRFLRRRTAIEYRRLTLLKLWQDGYYERVLRKDDQSALLQGHFTVTDSIRAPSSTRSTTSRPETTRAKTVYS